MAKWILKDSTGISIGGEFYQADKDGVVDVPDNVGGLSNYGFERYQEKISQENEKKKGDK